MLGAARLALSKPRRPLPHTLGAMYAATSTQPAAHGAAYSGPNGSTPNGNPPHYTITALKRWSCQDKNLPPVADIKAIHVYDFDNTLFASPLPNKEIWNSPTLNQLASPDVFLNGGWWHDSNLLASTGEGVEKEELRAWEGWWNEQIVTLVELSMQQKDALSVLLTGRAEAGFADLIKRIARSKKLEFDMVCLKPATGPSKQKFRSTMNFKQELLKDIVYTYRDAEEIRIYEDRPKHTKGFRDFFFNFNKDLMNNQLPTTRKSLIAEVVQVAENAKTLDPVTEVAEIQRMCNAHNLRVKAGEAPPGTPPYQIKKTVFYTGYMVQAPVTKKLISLVKLPPGMPEGDIRYLANSILITPKPAPKSILDKVGGIGAKVVWKVTGVACLENKLWAARVEPVPKTTKYYSENATPTVVLALRKTARPADAVRINNWHPVSDGDAFTFESVVGERKQLRIEEEQANENQYESYFPNKTNAKRTREDSQDGNGAHVSAYRAHNPRPNDDRRTHAPPHRGGNDHRGRGHRDFSSGRGRGRGRGGGGGGGGYGRGGGRGRGRGGPPSQYRSLDDVGEKPYGQPNYGDEPDPGRYY